MQPYGRGQTLGSGINPESFKQDYSGFTRAAEIQSRGMTNLGNQIGGVIDKAGDYFKQQSEDKKNVQKSKSLAKAIGDLIPELKPTVDNSLMILNNEELPLSARTAEAESIRGILELGIGEVRNRRDFGLKEEDLAQGQARLRADAIYKASQLGIAQQNADSRTKAAAASGNAPPSITEVAVPGGIQKMQYDPATQSYVPIKTSGLSTGEGNQANPIGALGGLPDPLKPFAGTFVTAGQKHNIDPSLLAAIAMHETGNGTSSAFRNKKNAMGVSNASGPVEMGSVEESIEKMAAIIGRGINEGTGPYANVNSIEDLANVYAPPNANNDPRDLNKFWTEGVTSNIKKLTQSGQPQANQVQRGVGFKPNEVPSAFRVATPQEASSYGATGGQIDEEGRFYPINPPSGMTVESDGEGGFRMVQGSGVGGSEQKSPNVKVPEGSTTIPDATSPTGTRVVQIPSEAIEKSKQDFSSYVQQMAGSYAKLDEMGKAVSGGDTNPLNFLEATPMGQQLSRAFGSDAQVFRDQINTMRPAITNVIRQAAEMGSKGMDSEKELQFYLSALGDPTLPLEANLKALDVLDKVYGQGDALNSILKEYPELGEKVKSYSLNLPKTPSVSSSESSSIYEKHGVK